MHITDEQKKAANNTDLVSYLESKGFQFKKVGTSYKPIVRSPYSGDMSSLSIFENRKGWKRWSIGEHGGDAISFLQMNMGMSFQEAVLELTSGQSFALPPVSSAPTHKSLSHATMANKITKKPEAWQAHSRISLAGTSDVALEHYLKSHTEVKEIHFVLDNDKAGQEAAEKYCKKYADLGYTTKNHVLKHKDMNEELKAFLNGKSLVKKNGMKI